MKNIYKIAFACGYFGTIGLVFAVCTIKIADKLTARIAKKTDKKEKSGE